MRRLSGIFEKKPHMRVALLDDVAYPDLELLAKAVGALGNDVRATTDPEQLLEALIRNEADSMIVDFRLDSLDSASTVQNGAELVALGAAISEARPTLLLTNHRRQADAVVSGLDPRLPIIVVSKPVGHREQEWIDALEAPLADLAQMTDAGGRLGIAANDLQSRLFELHAADLEALSEDERLDLEIDAAEELAPLLADLWRSCDSDWVMLSRIESMIMVLHRGEDQSMLSAFQIQNRERELDAPCLILGRPVIIEEGLPSIEPEPIDCTPDASGKNWRGYPFVRLRIADSVREFHLDTGSPWSFISLELLREEGVQLPAFRYKHLPISDQGHRTDSVQALVFELPVTVMGPEKTHSLTVPVQAVRQWNAKKNALNAPCRLQRCPGSYGDQCGRRLGLFGRGALYSLPEGLWAFDPSSGHFFVAG